MKEITILSGKGGTGKTSITAAIGSLTTNAVFCDNDVDAANLHLIFQPEIKETSIFPGAYVAKINSELCTQCGICQEYCRFDAIDTLKSGVYQIDQYKCEGCRLCERICPAEAITSERSTANFIYISNSRFGKFVHASMGAGEENSGKLVSNLRMRARQIAKENQSSWIINDGPPGIGCAAISSLTGADLALIVTEPTKSGMHDLKRVVELIHSFAIPAYAIINKYNLNSAISSQIEEFLNKNSIETIAKIPFSEEIVHAMIAGKNIIEFNPLSAISLQIRGGWEKIESGIGE